MPRVGFEPTIPVFERATIFHALERATTGSAEDITIDFRELWYDNGEWVQLARDIIIDYN
jgi:hypothetical protein